MIDIRVCLEAPVCARCAGEIGPKLPLTLDGVMREVELRCFMTGLWGASPRGRAHAATILELPDSTNFSP